ncbi:S9 family peptidase [Cecembia calidifontis]|uniref:Dipeptidyl aminopeptidase/acylaminoacyl peptidase n=1 Tax=Cecembia calidifontis TaxID=1187080 RepID=A0A4Q7P9S6_9BACT|nr:prolyl oligopeptidase family serine peptidase [Cecembia calidifontis]RZS96667.1 dipeptidyl aminopeptidase/acylaminoacyl peptidase [Cecembia calidifontis]
MKREIFRSAILLVLLVFAGKLEAQQKRSLTHADYDAWESLNSDKISKDGSWVGFEISPQEGDGRLEIVSHGNPNQRIVIPRGTSWAFSHDSRFGVGKISPEFEAVRLLKLKKTKPEDMPKDSLFIVHLEKGNIEKYARVKSYAVPEKAGNWLAIHFEKELPGKELKKEEKDTTMVESSIPKPRKTDGTQLIVRTFDGSKQFEYHRVKEYGFSENGTHLYYVKAHEDTLKNTGIFLLDLQTGISKIIDVRKTEYLNPAFSESSKFLAYLSTEDSAKAKRPYYDLFLYDILKEQNQKIASKGTLGMQGMVSKNGKLSFSQDDSRLYFGTAPDYVRYAYEEDTTILDEDRVKLDIWGWQDAEIQPMQLRNKTNEERRSYLASYNLKSRRIVTLSDEKVPQVSMDRKRRLKYALGFDDSAYRRNYSWDIQIGKDVYLIDLETGTRTLVRKDVPGNPQLSPAGKYVYWYDSRDSSWVSYEVQTKLTRNLTKGLKVNFYNEQHDSPSLPGSYGSAGWLKDDVAFLVYDKFDIWKIDPTGKTRPINVTQGEGRKQNIVYRRERLDPEEESIDSSQPLMLSLFHEENKKSGYAITDYSGRVQPKVLLFSDHRYLGLSKAENSANIILRRSTYQDFPDVYATDLVMQNLSRLSSANPQQKEVKWGTVELVNYLANDGTPLQGLLFKPEDFDPEKKYPLMVYFYERNSDGLHLYRTPAPSASTINIPYFVSNDYLVFVPDIKYDLGLPGPSAYNCIIPGVQSIVARGYVDKESMAIQGQSWGGYQVAYLITRTNMFKAAGAGAPVVNMTSAYGGIRWGTGMSRMFQYEQTQSRIGGTLWDKPLYYIENSPLFFMDRVNTPVLIMHNDDDGAVPWYQGIEMFMALKRLNKPAWLLQYNGEDHNLRLRKNRKDLSIRMSQFFDHYLKGAPAPLWMTEGLPAVEKGRTLKYELEAVDY